MVLMDRALTKGFGSSESCIFCETMQLQQQDNQPWQMCWRPGSPIRAVFWHSSSGTDTPVSWAQCRLFAYSSRRQETGRWRLYLQSCSQWPSWQRRFVFGGIHYWAPFWVRRFHLSNVCQCYKCHVCKANVPFLFVVKKRLWRLIADCVSDGCFIEVIKTRRKRTRQKQKWYTRLIIIDSRICSSHTNRLD